MKRQTHDCWTCRHDTTHAEGHTCTNLTPEVRAWIRDEKTVLVSGGPDTGNPPRGNKHDCPGWARGDS